MGEWQRGRRIPTVTHFRELRVYLDAFDASMEIFVASRKWPAEERFSLTNQIRRSSRSVCGQIAEGWCKRRYVAHFRSKLTDADSEVAETQAWLEFALSCEYITKEWFERLDSLYATVSDGLVSIIDRADRWCAAASQVREEEVGYADTPTLCHSDTPILPVSESDD